ncbi:MAG: Cof-type HAD-IIB family hydrolase [Oscillospiraceae bacterium]
MIKAIFFDIDGTLRSFRDKVIPQSAIDALKALKKNGIKLFVATGRGKGQLEFLKDIFEFDGMVAQNGQYCYAGDRVLRRQLMDKDDVAEIVRASENMEYPCVLEDSDTMFLTYTDDKVREVMSLLDLPKPEIRSASSALSTDILKAIVFVDKAREHLISDRIKNSDLFRWHPEFVDVGYKNGGKNIGIDAVLDFFGIDIADTMSFGDGENDIAMLKHTAIGVAMGNSSNEVKASADYVTDHVDDNGIANALRHFELI